jgi:hypothetical protein
MMVNSAQPGEDGGARPPPFTLTTITSDVVVYASGGRADTLLLFLLCPLWKFLDIKTLDLDPSELDPVPYPYPQLCTLLRFTVPYRKGLYTVSHI